MALSSTTNSSLAQIMTSTGFTDSSILYDPRVYYNQVLKGSLMPDREITVSERDYTAYKATYEKYQALLVLFGEACKWVDSDWIGWKHEETTDEDDAEMAEKIEEFLERAGDFLPDYRQ